MWTLVLQLQVIDQFTQLILFDSGENHTEYEKHMSLGFYIANLYDVKSWGCVISYSLEFFMFTFPSHSYALSIILHNYDIMLF